jgi:hypothetical protein
VVASAAHLFEPRAAYRFRTITRPSTTYDDPTTGEDPQYGASINYWLSGPADSLPTITILDDAGRLVRTLRGTNHAGINRIQWDLRDEPSTAVRLLTSPMYAEHIAVGPEGRPAPSTSSLTVLQAPGSYTVKLSVDGVEQVQSLEVRKDPNSGGTEAEIGEQNELLYAIKEDLEAGAEAVRRIEALRVQLQTLGRFVEDEEVEEAIAAFEKKLVDLEMDLVDLRLTGQGQDGVRFEAKLLPKLAYLPRGFTNADFRPTDQDVEVQEILAGQLKERLSALEGLLSGDLAELNALLREKGVPNIGGEEN